MVKTSDLRHITEDDQMSRNGNRAFILDYPRLSHIILDSRIDIKALSQNESYKKRLLKDYRRKFRRQFLDGFDEMMEDFEILLERMSEEYPE